MKNPESTSNPEAKVLILRAKDKCSACATHWRLQTAVFAHWVDGRAVHCKAVPERAELRRIAAKARGAA